MLELLISPGTVSLPDMSPFARLMLNTRTRLFVTHYQMGSFASPFVLGDMEQSVTETAATEGTPSLG